MSSNITYRSIKKCIAQRIKVHINREKRKKRKWNARKCKKMKEKKRIQFRTHPVGWGINSVGTGPTRHQGTQGRAPQWLSFWTEDVSTNNNSSAHSSKKQERKKEKRRDTTPPSWQNSATGPPSKSESQSAWNRETSPRYGANQKARAGTVRWKAGAATERHCEGTRKKVSKLDCFLLSFIFFNIYASLVAISTTNSGFTKNTPRFM